MLSWQLAPHARMRSLNADPKTIEGFGREWSRFDQSGGLHEAGRQNIRELYFRIFPWDTLPANAVGFDLGCGSWRWDCWLSPQPLRSSFSSDRLRGRTLIVNHGRNRDRLQRRIRSNRLLAAANNLLRAIIHVTLGLNRVGSPMICVFQKASEAPYPSTLPVVAK
jgi:hypothetical protein